MNKTTTKINKRKNKLKWPITRIYFNALILNTQIRIRVRNNTRDIYYLGIFGLGQPSHLKIIHFCPASVLSISIIFSHYPDNLFGAWRVYKTYIWSLISVTNNYRTCMDLDCRSLSPFSFLYTVFFSQSYLYSVSVQVSTYLQNNALATQRSRGSVSPLSIARLCILGSCSYVATFTHSRSWGPKLSDLYYFVLRRWYTLCSEFKFQQSAHIL